MTHELKIWPQFFEAVSDGTKTFEYRVNDRDYNPGDMVILKEWEMKGSFYTGREITFEIGFMLETAIDTHVVFSLLTPDAK